MRAPGRLSALTQNFRSFFPFAAAVSVAAAAAGSLTELSVHTWYQHLIKPSWTAPAPVFGPVWTVLYAAMAAAAWQVYRKSGWEGGRGALTLWGIQLVLNAMWPGCFFALRSPALGAFEIVILLGFVLWTTVSFFRHDRTAGLMMVPYAAWGMYATALTLAIWSLNR